MATYFLSRKYGLGCPYPAITARLNGAFALESGCTLPDCVRCFIDGIDTTTTPPDPDDDLDCDIVITVVTTDQVCANLTFFEV